MGCNETSQIRYSCTCCTASMTFCWAALPLRTQRSLDKCPCPCTYCIKLLDTSDHPLCKRRRTSTFATHRRYACTQGFTSWNCGILASTVRRRNNNVSHLICHPTRCTDRRNLSSTIAQAVKITGLTSPLYARRRSQCGWPQVQLSQPE